MDGPGCRWLIRDLLYYSNSLAQLSIEKHTVTITSTLSADPSMTPQRRTKAADPSESFSRLSDDQIQCNTRLFQEPTNLQGDPVEVLWQVRKEFTLAKYLVFTAPNVCSTRNSAESVTRTSCNSTITRLVQNRQVPLRQTS